MLGLEDFHLVKSHPLTLDTAPINASIAVAPAPLVALPHRLGLV